MTGEHNYLHNGLGMQNPSAFNHMNIVNFQQMFWIMVFFQQAFNRSNLFLLDAPADDLDSPIDVTPKLSILPKFHHLLVQNSLQSITFQNRNFSLLTWPIQYLSIQPSPIRLSLICDQLLLKLPTQSFLVL